MAGCITAAVSTVLVVELRSGSGEVRTLRFDAAFDRRVIIGRANECDIVLQDSGVSRKHGMLLATPGGWRVHDLGSSNGTWLNGRLVKEAAFGKNDVVRIGLSELRIVSGADEAARLVVDLESGTARVGDEALPLSAAELVWFGYLAVHAARGGGWVIAGADGHADFADFTTWVFERDWAKAVKSKPLLDLSRGREVDDEDLKNLRGKTAQKLRAFCSGTRGWMEALVVPEVEGKNRQRLPGPVVVKGVATLP